MMSSSLSLSLTRFTLLWLGIMLSITVEAVENFPRPPELERDVNFWVRVYSEVNTNAGFIHDARNLAVVYETLELSGNRRRDNATIKAAKARYAAILKQLSTSQGGAQSATARRVAGLWGDATPKRLQQAAAELRFQRGQANRFQAGLVRSGQWQDYIHQVLAEHKLPAELAVLPHVESSFNPEAYSSAGAAGIWQFTRATGRRYMDVDYVVDERMDPYAATVAAAQLLKHNLQLTGTWPLALTAYNHGASSMRRATKQLGTTDIAIVVRQYQGRSFGFASRNFYVSFLAALEVSSNPEKYFAPLRLQPPVDYLEARLPDYVPVDAYARAFNVDLEHLKDHNRALLEPVWNGKKRVPPDHTLRVPRGNRTDKTDQLLAKIPATERFSEQTPDLLHKVVRGDTISEIAQRYGHGVRDIATMNGLDKRYRIRVGQVLRLPLEGSLVTAELDTSMLPATSPPAPATDSPTESEPEVTPLELATLVPIDPGLLADPGDYRVASDNSIEVQGSETLGHYADWLDLRSSQLRSLNGMRYGRPVVMGHRLMLDFSRVSVAEFEARRLTYQQELQQAFFMAWHIHATRKHVIAPGESLWVLTNRQFKVPLWLLRQYNPDLDFDKLKPGTVIVVPELAET